MTCVLNQDKLRTLVGYLYCTGNIGWGAQPQGWEWWHERVSKLKSYIENSYQYRTSVCEGGAYRYNMQVLLSDCIDWTNSYEGFNYWSEFSTAIGNAVDNPRRTIAHSLEKQRDTSPFIKMEFVI